MSRLVLLLGQTPDAPVRWAVSKTGDKDGGGEAALAGAGTAPALTSLAGRLPAHDQLVCILPGERVATRRLRLPVSDRQAESAAKLAFEDALAEPVANFSFAWTPQDDGDRLVSAAPKDWLAGWLAALAAAGLDPDILAVDHACLSAEGHDGVILRERGRVTAKVPGGGLTAPEDFALPIIQRMADAGEGTASLLTVRIGPSGERIGAESLVLADERALSAFYLASLARAPVPNFRRGALAKRRTISADVRGWRLAAGLMAACLTLWLAASAVTGYRHHAAADRLRAEAAEQYRSAFPDSRIRDLRRQAERRAAGPGGSAFLPLSAALTSALEETGQVTLSGLTYTEGGQLVADVRYADFGELERLTDNLRARGLTAQEGQSPRRGDDGDYQDRITLALRGAS